VAAREVRGRVTEIGELATEAEPDFFHRSAHDGGDGKEGSLYDVDVHGAGFGEKRESVRTP
jgi:hypothetical protein